MQASGQSHWEAVYEKKSFDQVSWFQETPETCLSFVAECGLSPKDRIIDVGGGSSSLAQHLIERGFEDVSVLDISAKALEQAKKNTHDPVQCTWLHEDVLQMKPPALRYKMWHDRAVFHFLTKAEDRLKYLEALNACLLPGGFLILATFSPAGPKQCSGLDVEQYDVEKMKTTLGEGFTLLKHETVVHKTPWESEQEFCFALFKKE